MAVYTAIDDPEAYFQAKIYTGNGTAIGSGGLALTFDGDTDMSPDMVWIKGRSTTYSHQLYDTVRGVTKRVLPDLSTAEETDTEALTAFGSDGFTLGSNAGVNTSSGTHVAWCWNESATAGFDIVGYTGTGSAKTESHSLSAIPHLMMVKNRDNDPVENWCVYHQYNTSAPQTDLLILNTTASTEDASNRWNDTAPTSSVFTVGTNNEVNKDGDAIIAYLWTEKQGFSKFGSYEGNGVANGTFVNTGFRPALVITKSFDSTSSWHIFDNKREGYNVDNDPLVAEVTDAEATTDMIDILSNGFKCRIATDPNVAESYVYMAFAEAPFVNSNGVPCNAR